MSAPRPPPPPPPPPPHPHDTPKVPTRSYKRRSQERRMVYGRRSFSSRAFHRSPSQRYRNGFKPYHHPNSLTPTSLSNQHSYQYNLYTPPARPIFYPPSYPPVPLPAQAVARSQIPHIIPAMSITTCTSSTHPQTLTSTPTIPSTITNDQSPLQVCSSAHHRSDKIGLYKNQSSTSSSNNHICNMKVDSHELNLSFAHSDNLKCIKYLAENASTLCVNNSKMFGLTIGRLIDPLYENITKQELNESSATDSKNCNDVSNNESLGRHLDVNVEGERNVVYEAEVPNTQSKTCSSASLSEHFNALKDNPRDVVASTPFMRNDNRSNFQPDYCDIDNDDDEDDDFIFQSPILCHDDGSSSYSSNIPKSPHLFGGNCFPLSGVTFGQCRVINCSKFEVNKSERNGKISSDQNTLPSVISKLLRNCSSLPFSKQSLVSFMEKPIPGLVGTSSNIPDISRIEGIVSYERSSGPGQIYMQQRLHNAGHATMSTTDLIDSIYNCNINSSGTSTLSDQIPVSIPYCHVPSTCNYLSDCKQFLVINNDMCDLSKLGFPKNANRPIQKCTDVISRMFHNGIGECFKYDNKKRSSKVSNLDSATENITSPPPSSKKRIRVKSVYKKDSNNTVTVDPDALPVINIGWTQSDCHQYNRNQSTLAGTVKPFLMNGGLHPPILRDIVEVMETVIGSLPPEHAFNVDLIGHDFEIETRKRMWSEMKRSFGCDGSVIDNFRAEGVTILIPDSVGWHKDILNCDIDGMQSVISVNVSIPINSQTFPFGTDGNQFYKWLLLNGYLDNFPVSIIFYGRKVVGNYCKRLRLHHMLSMEGDLVKKCIAWGLVNRMGTVVDYRSRIWNNPMYPSWFQKNTSVNKSSMFKERFDKTPASYDKICHYSVIIDIYIDLHFNFIGMDVRSTLHYVCFFAFESNGTSAIAEMHRVIMDDTDTHLALLKNSCDGNFYTFLVETYRRCFPEKKSVGSSTDNRSQFCGTGTDWSVHDENLLLLCNEFWRRNKSKRLNKKATEGLIRETIDHLVNDREMPTSSKEKGKIKYHGAGEFTSTQFIQVASLLGLIPLYCFTFADVREVGLGPAKFIQRALNKKMDADELSEYFRGVHKEFVTIWGFLITLGLLENMLCEFNRSYKESCERYVAKNHGSKGKKKKNAQVKKRRKSYIRSLEIPVDVIMDDSYAMDSKKYDLVFYNKKRGCVQNFFCVKSVGQKATELRPVLFFKDSGETGDKNADSIIALTNWWQDESDNQHLYWDRGIGTSILSLDTKLMSHEKTGYILKQRYKV